MKKASKHKPRKTYTYEKYGKPKQEPSKLLTAKENAPEQSHTNLIFYWNHASDSFKFSHKLRRLRN